VAGRSAWGPGRAMLYASARMKESGGPLPARPVLHAVEILLEPIEAPLHRCSGKYVMGGAPDIARKTIVVGACDARRPRHCLAQGLEKFSEERIGREHVGIVVERRE